MHKGAVGVKAGGAATVPLPSHLVPEEILF